MSSATSSRISQIMRNMESGKYRKQFKFANFGSVVEDSIVAQQMYADQKLKQIQFQRSQRKART
jgi:hypothetical protein